MNLLYWSSQNLRLLKERFPERHRDLLPLLVKNEHGEDVVDTDSPAFKEMQKKHGLMEGKLRSLEQEGPRLWRQIHTWAAVGDPSKFLTSLSGLIDRMPCDNECKPEARKYIAEHAVDTSSREKLFEWTVHFHNDVNKRKGKPLYSMQTAKQEYFNSIPLIIDLDGGIGDVAMSMAAVRDLHLAYPTKFKTELRVWCKDMLNYFPYQQTLTVEERKAARTIRLSGYNRFNGFMHYQFMWYRALQEELGVMPPMTRLGGGIFLSDEEKRRPRPFPGRYWILVTGHKDGWSAKQWPASYFQQVVDHYQGEITFVQTGESHHPHTKLTGVVNWMDKPLRELLVAMYHADGVLCAESFLYHLAAGVELPPGRTNRHAVVVMGGRMDPLSFQYKTQTLLHTTGSMDCCASGGCGKVDNCPKMWLDGDTPVPECGMRITPDMVIREIDRRIGKIPVPAQFNSLYDIVTEALKIDGATWQEDLYVLAKLTKQAKAKTGLDIGTAAGRTAKLLLLAGVEKLWTVDDFSGRWRANPQESSWGKKDEAASSWMSGDFRITQIKAGSLENKSVIEQSLQPLDIAWIDGNHDYEHVSSDIDLARKFVVKGGIICGHDWNLPQVAKAVREKFGKSVRAEQNIWWVRV